MLNREKVSLAQSGSKYVQPDLLGLDRQVNTGSIVAMWTDIESIVYIYVYIKKRFHLYDRLICLSAAYISRVARVRLACVQGLGCFGEFEDSPYSHSSGSSVLLMNRRGVRRYVVKGVSYQETS